MACRLHSTVEVRNRLGVFGEIVASLIWKDVLNTEREGPCALLDIAVFLEDGVFARIEKAIAVPSGRHPLQRCARPGRPRDVSPTPSTVPGPLCGTMKPTPKVRRTRSRKRVA